MKIGKKKIYALPYTDDVALLMEDKEDMKEMMRKLERRGKKWN